MRRKVWEYVSGYQGLGAESSLVAFERGRPLEDCISTMREGLGQELMKAESSIHGSPYVIIIASSAVGANNYVKKLHILNRVRTCRFQAAIFVMLPVIAAS